MSLRAKKAIPLKGATHEILCKNHSRFITRAGNNVLRLQDRHVCAAKRRAVSDDADVPRPRFVHLHSTSDGVGLGCAEARRRMELVDLVCLPYDLCQPYHGCYLRIVDEDGRPVQGAEIDGHFDLGGDAFSGTTDAAGEFKINRLHNVKGVFWASCDNHASWYQSRDFDVANAKAESDGKIVFQYTLSKMNPGGWKAKKDISREELQKLIPGKWSADKESRRWLMDGFNCSFANDPGRYCMTLDKLGSAVAYVPFGYRFGKDKSKLGPRYSSWSIQRNGNVTGGKDDPYRNDPPAEWVWRIRLAENSDEKTFPGWSGDYYLGEDEKGIYLSPGPFSSAERLSEKLSIKYRKVVE